MNALMIHHLWTRYDSTVVMIDILQTCMLAYLLYLVVGLRIEIDQLKRDVDQSKD